MFRFALGEEVRYSAYAHHAWYYENFMYEIIRCHYTEYMSKEGELLYSRSYDIAPIMYRGKEPTDNQRAGHTYTYIAEDLILTEVAYQKQLVQAAAAAVAP